jgi:uncharacterized protein (DUF2252 family)
MTTRLADDIARGRELRGRLKRSAHATVPELDRDPVSIVVAQNAERLPDLVPIRMSRMLQSPFAYYRGTAAVMAADLRHDAVTGLEVVSSGDAHLANFGLYGSPERDVLFDLNDFDEASTAPWEWDVKRLATSVVLAGRERGFGARTCRDAAASAVRSYRERLAELFRRSALDRYYFHVDTDGLERTLRGAEKRLLRKTVDKARAASSEHALAKLTVTSGRIQDVPPLTRHVDPPGPEQLAQLLALYAKSLDADVAVLLSQFQLRDAVLKVVGVGSVGTRCYLLLLTGPAGESLFLQAKEAVASVLDTYGGRPPRLPAPLPTVRRDRQGYRVITGQRLLQADPDRFLGWVKGWDDGSGVARDCYVRQFKDLKGGVDTSVLTARELADYASLCAAQLARAHTQTPGAAAVSGYLGKSTRFDGAVAQWSHRYADQVERDYAALQAAARSGRVPVEPGS